ncbi:hypothetical protein HPULCUR_001551 [Helicostylum pulchrum]|uniref:Uncharacterized protein n=1 Tax=Helicostylum pulchrum TaxID=562976 RepID=A0ABP9XN04_9FUNG
MTDYQNRAEGCSAQRVEPRKIRTEYKQEMKASRCLDHNAKKFRKTVFYRHLKQTSQMNVAVDIPDTCKYQEEGPSHQPDTAIYQEEGNIRVVYNPTDQAVNVAADKEECDAVEASSSETGTLTVMAVKKLKSLLKALILHKMSTVSN